MRNKENKKYSAPALERGLEIIELLAQYPEGLKLTEIAERMGKTKAQIFRMISVLSDKGYVDSFPREHLYRLSLKIFRISHRYSPINNLSTVAQPAMKELCHATGHSCHIVVYSEGGGLIAAQKHPDINTNRLELPIGGKGPLTRNCAGHVLLAFASYDERERMLEAYADNHKTDIDHLALRETLNRVSEQGFETMKSPVIQGVLDIGYPVFDHMNKAIAVLMVSALLNNNTSLEEKRAALKPHIEKASLDISRMLGQEQTNRQATAE